MSSFIRRGGPGTQRGRRTVVGRGVGGGGPQPGKAGPSALSSEGLSPLFSKVPVARAPPHAPLPRPARTPADRPRGSAAPAGLPLLSGTIYRSPEAQEAGGVRRHQGALADVRAQLWRCCGRRLREDLLRWVQGSAPRTAQLAKAKTLGSGPPGPTQDSGVPRGVCRPPVAGGFQRGAVRARGLGFQKVPPVRVALGAWGSVLEAPPLTRSVLKEPAAASPSARGCREVPRAGGTIQLCFSYSVLSRFQRMVIKVRVSA